MWPIGAEERQTDWFASAFFDGAGAGIIVEVRFGVTGAGGVDFDRG